jgi:hypothetical protein
MNIIKAAALGIVILGATPALAGQPDGNDAPAATAHHASHHRAHHVRRARHVRAPRHHHVRHARHHAAHATTMNSTQQATPRR